MANQEFSKIDIKTLVTVIVRGGNKIGFNLAKTLVEQGSRVIIIDEYTSESKKYISKLKKIGKVDFIDIESLVNFFDTIGRIDYLIYLQYDFLLENDVLNSRDFLNESNNLDLSIKSALKYNSKFALVNTIKLNKKLAIEASDPNYAKPSPYSTLELQKYSESLVAEYHDKSNADARIIRLGNLIGKDPVNLNYDPTLKKILYEAVQSSTVNIPGEGLEPHYLLNTSDAYFGILKLVFNTKTNGEVVSLCNENEYTTLSLAYKVLELDPNATEIKFTEAEKKRKLGHDFYIPAENASNYGWEQKIPLEKTIKETLGFVYDKAGEEWIRADDKSEVEKRLQKETQADLLRKDPRRAEFEAVEKEKGVRTLKTPFGKFIDKLKTTFKKAIYDKEKDYEEISWGKILKFFGFTAAFSVIFYFILGPILAIFINAGLIYLKKDDIQENLSSYQFESIVQDIDEVNFRMSNITDNFSKLEWIFKVVNKEKEYANYESFLYSLELGAKGAKNGVKALSPLAMYIREFQPALNFEGESTGAYTREYREYLSKLDENKDLITKASYDLVLAGNLLQDVDTEIFPNRVENEVVEIKELGVKAGNMANDLTPIIKFLPELLGINERQRYLFLLQNPSEIRSAGGWISSYVVLGVEGGQVRELEVDDIYNLDGLLKTQGKSFEAPQDMQEALGIDTWNTSLSNWSPDFVTAANSAEFFIKESDKVYKLDGIVAVNLSFVQDLLDVWDGVEVPRNQSETTALDSVSTELVIKENMYDKIFEMHKAYQPGDTRKADFLASLSNVVFQKLLSSELTEYAEISDVLVSSFESKDLIAYVKDQNVNKYMSLNGWSGDLKSSYKNAPIKVEWNWGANKANLFLSKQSTLRAEIVNQDEVNYLYTFVVQNNSSTDIYPEGDYENYMRIYLPEDALVTSTRGFVNNDYDSYYSNDFKVVGGWFNVPVKSTQTFEIKYTVKRVEGEDFPIELAGEVIKMDLDCFMQPGDMNHQYAVEVVYPENWALEDSGTNLGDGGLVPVSTNLLSGEWALERDLEVDLQWVWK